MAIEYIARMGPTALGAPQILRQDLGSEKKAPALLPYAVVAGWSGAEPGGNGKIVSGSGKSAAADPERHGIELSLLRHVSPIEWDNIVLYGEYASIADSSGGRAHGLSVQNRTDLPDTLRGETQSPSARGEVCATAPKDL